MSERKRRYEEVSPLEFLLLRQKLGYGRYRKIAPRDPEKTAVLIRLGLARIAEQEREDFIPLGPRRRRVVIP